MFDLGVLTSESVQRNLRIRSSSHNLRTEFWPSVGPKQHALPSSPLIDHTLSFILLRSWFGREVNFRYLTSYQRIISLSWLFIQYTILELSFLGIIATTLKPFQFWVLFSNFFGSLFGSQFIYILFPICLFISSLESLLMDLSCLKYDGWPYSKLLLTFPMKAIIDFRKLFHHSWNLCLKIK